jgi:hypothetical protein
MASNDLQQFCADNEDVIEELVQTFSDYMPLSGVSQSRIVNWLGQFRPEHTALALQVAKSIQYYGSHSVDGNLRALGKAILWHIRHEAIPFNGVFYVPVGSVAESGQDIARRYRNVNGMQRRKDQFVHIRELPEKLFEHQRTMVVFLDDFVGTGNEVCGFWREAAEGLVPEYVPIYLGVIAAYADGIKRIEEECPITVVTIHELDSRHKLIDAANTAFTQLEKDVLEQYCQQWGNCPLGYCDMGALVSFFHGTPNDAPSLIRGSRKQRPYRGLLPGWPDLH